MVVAFTVGPRSSTAPKLSELVNRYGRLAPRCTDMTGWSGDFRVYFSFMHPIVMDPFHPGIVGASGANGVDVVDDYLLGRDCKMSKKEWRRFCLEVLLLDVPIPQDFDAVVGVVDKMLVTIVRCVAGCEEFSAATGAKLMTLVMALARFLLLCGGSGMLPREYALARFGAAKAFDDCARVVDVQVRVFAQKVVRRLTSLGRCVRGLVRVAWGHSVWREPELMSKLGLEASRSYCLSDVWRAAVGSDCGLAVVMRSVVGPSYDVAGAGPEVLMRSALGPHDLLGPMAVNHEDHEYDVTAWGRGGLPQSPLSSDTLVGNSVALLVSAGGRMVGFGGIDRQVKLFIHNFQMGFCHERHFRGLGGDNPVVMDLLDLMGITFGAGFDGKGVPGQFQLRGGRSWYVGGRDGLHVFGEDEGEAVASFLSALDGTRPVVVDEEAAFKESMMASARQVVTNFARARGFDDNVMEMIASVSFEDLMG